MNLLLIRNVSRTDVNSAQKPPINSLIKRTNVAADSELNHLINKDKNIFAILSYSFSYSLELFGASTPLPSPCWVGEGRGGEGKNEVMRSIHQQHLHEARDFCCERKQLFDSLGPYL